jgi:SHS2 domain-containing protein
VLPHTADVGLEATAADLPALFEEAGRALAEVAADFPSEALSSPQEGVEVEARDLVALAYAWLNELVTRAEVEHAALVVVRVDAVEGPLDDPSGPWRLRARIGFRPFRDPDVRPRRQVKSATFHGLVVQQHGNGWLLRAYLDV